jgi:hypothetical protein
MITHRVRANVSQFFADATSREGQGSPNIRPGRKVGATVIEGSAASLRLDDVAGK